MDVELLRETSRGSLSHRPPAERLAALRLAARLIHPVSVRPLRTTRGLEVEGSYEFRVGERVVRVGPGACVFGPRGIPHAYKNIGSAPSRHLVIITPAGFEKFLEELSQLPPGPPDLEVLTRIARRYELVFV
jgi:hypothetical protein